MCTSMHFLPTTLNTNKKMKYKNFLHEVARSCISAVQNPIDSSSNELQWPEKQPTPRGPKKEPPQADSLWISANTNWTKLLLVGRARSILQDSIKCVLHLRSEVKLHAVVNSTLFCFIKGLVLRNTTQLGTTRLYICSFFTTEFRSIIYTVKLQGRIYSGVEHVRV